MNDVTNIRELMAKFDESNENKLENSEHMFNQFESSLERYSKTLLNGYSQVLYIDRSKQDTDKVVEMKAMWFDSLGNKVERPVEIINQIKKNQRGEE